MVYRYIIILFLISLPIAQDIIGQGLEGDELITFLRSNYKTSSTLGYTDARDTLYLNIDRIDGVVRGVYSNYSVNLPDNGLDPSTYLYENGINCEHVWPQSMYEGSEPQKSDMHALRPTKDNVNSARGNKPFNEIPDATTSTWYWESIQTSQTPSVNIDQYSENSSNAFEPREDRKGDIARTIFYFYTIYESVSNDNFFSTQKDILKLWHQEDPANDEEINRTWAIAYYQQNKPNPFILDPTLIQRSYFYNESINGDINNDGILNVLDLVELVNIILFQDDIDDADINNDGQINILDLVFLADIILSKK